MNLFNRHKHLPFRVLADGANTAPDIILFTGGPDINPAFYEEDTLRGTNISAHRDEMDQKSWSRWRELPKVGICRGAQFLNVKCGGAMWQHVDNHTTAHRITNLLNIPNEFSQGDLFYVTSTHHQMMIPGKNAEVIAIAQEKGKGIATEYKSAKERAKPEFDTEVVWYENEECLCFQPHPEYHSRDSTELYFMGLMNYFFNE